MSSLAPILGLAVTIDGHDPLDVLPPEARRKLEAMQDAAAMRHAALRLASDRQQEAHQAWWDADMQLSRLLAMPSATDRHGTERPDVVQQRAKVEHLAAARDRAARAHEVAAAEWRALKGPEQSCSDYVKRRLIGVHVEMAPAVEARLPKGETIQDAVERLRGEIHAMNAEARRIESAPFPASEVLARLLGTVDALADHGRPDVRPVFRDLKESARWPEAPVYSYRGQRAQDGGMAQDAAALICWILKEPVKAALKREVEAIAKDADAVPAADRPRLLAELLVKRMHAERVEEAFIEMAAASGVVIPRREDADPRCILGLADGAPEPKAH